MIPTSSSQGVSSGPSSRLPRRYHEGHTIEKANDLSDQSTNPWANGLHVHHDCNLGLGSIKSMTCSIGHGSSCQTPRVMSSIYLPGPITLGLRSKTLDLKPSISNWILFEIFNVGWFIPMTDPWDERHMCLHEWLMFMVNVGTSRWFQSIWKICSSNWIISPGTGENKKQGGPENPKANR